MDKQQFIDRLSTTDNLSDSEKIEVCQYYIDNYPVSIKGIAIRLMLKIEGGSSNAINHAFNQLKRRINEFK